MSASACTRSYAWLSSAFNFGNASGSGPRGVQEHPSCSPAGFQQPRSCDWISLCPPWEQLYPANSWICVRYWCWRRFSGLASSICCGICPAGPRLAWPWIIGVPLFLLRELSAGLADFRRRHSKSFSARNTCTLCPKNVHLFIFWITLSKTNRFWWFLVC